MTHIFLETGKSTTSEAVFISTLVKMCGFDSALNVLNYVNGYKNLIHLIPTLQAYGAEGNKNVIIFDADRTENNGGFLQRKQEISLLLKKHHVQADVFLFPNNQADGDFETLIEQLIIKEKHRKWLDCYGDYENCLGDDYVHPNLKGKLFTYISAMKMKNSQRKKLGNGEWMFDNNTYWNLNSEALRPLKAFLSKNCS